MASVFQIMCSKISRSCYLIMRSCYLCYCEFFYSSTCTCSHGHIRLSRLLNYHVGGSTVACRSFRTTSCMACTGIYCAALCTLRCCTLVHIHPKLHRANDFPRHINRTHHPQWSRQEPSMESHHTSKRLNQCRRSYQFSTIPLC